MNRTLITKTDWLLVISVGALATTVFNAGEISGSPQVAATVTIAVAVIGILALVRLLPGRSLTLGSVYFFIFVLFHAGLLPYVLLGLQPRLLVEALPYDSAWFLSPFLGAAITTAAVGMLAFLVGYAATFSCARGRWPASLQKSFAARSENTSVGTVGFVLVALGVALWFVIAFVHGSTSFFAMSYGLFRAETAGSPLPHAYLLIGLGMGALGLSPSARQRRWGLVIFALYALPAFAIGNRGVVIIPLAAWLVAAARRREIKIRLWHVVMLFLGLTAGSIIRQVRQTGLSTGVADLAFNPFDGLAELGMTIRTLVVAHEWHFALAEPFVGWGTYLAPLERLILGRLLDDVVTPISLDSRVFSTTVMERAGPIGGSPVAESYRAAGLVGVVVVMVLIGVLAAWLDLRPAGSVSDYAVGMIGYVLLLWTRNDFTPVPVQLLVCIMVIGFGVFERLKQAAVRLFRRSDRSPDSVPVELPESSSLAGVS